MKFTQYFIMAVILAIAAAFILPNNQIIENTVDILTVSSLIFTIISGFYIASALSNYFKLQSLVSEETSGLMSLYHVCRSQSKDIAKKMAEAIDKYLISSFDFELIESVANTRKEFNKIIEVTDEIAEKDTELFGEILSIRRDLLKMRQEFDLAARRIVSLFEWVLLIVLAMLNIVLICSLGEPTIMSYMVTSLLVFAITFILVLINLLDNNTLSEEKISFLIYQGVFKEIGKLPYFTEEDIKIGRVSPPKEAYRLGRNFNNKKGSKKIVIIKP